MPPGHDPVSRCGVEAFVRLWGCLSKQGPTRDELMAQRRSLNAAALLIDAWAPGEHGDRKSTGQRLET